MTEEPRTWKGVVVLVCFVVFAASWIFLIVAGCGSTVTSTTTATVAKPLRAMSAPATCHAQAGGLLPDPACTPGVVDSTITQANIGSTICVRGYTARVRPPTSYTNALKLRQMAQYGYVNVDPRRYEEDHLVSLELGGDPRDPRNLWPEVGASPNRKDGVENRLHREVCADRISLAQAQSEIVDWMTAK